MSRRKPPHDLAAPRLRQGVGEADVVGPGQRPDVLGDVRLQFGLQLVARRDALLQRHEADDPLALELVRPADHRGLRDLGVMHQGAFDLHRAEAVAARRSARRRRGP